jgi:hypothetical protein
MSVAPKGKGKKKETACIFIADAQRSNILIAIYRLDSS